MRRVALVVFVIVASVLLARTPARDFAVGVETGVLGMLIGQRLLRGRSKAAPVEPGLRPLLGRLEERGWAVSVDEQIVVGPPGAYLIESRRALAGMSTETEARLRAHAKEARRLLGAANLHWVRPVVVVWGQFPEQVAEHGGVTYVHGERFADWLSEQPATVSPQSLESARSCLRRLEADSTRAAA